MQTYTKPNDFDLESDTWPISDHSKNFLKNYLLHNALGMDMLSTLLEILILECTTIKYILLLPWEPRIWVHYKKFGVVRYDSSDVELLGTLDQDHC